MSRHYKLRESCRIIHIFIGFNELSSIFEFIVTLEFPFQLNVHFFFNFKHS